MFFNSLFQLLAKILELGTIDSVRSKHLFIDYNSLSIFDQFFFITIFCLLLQGLAQKVVYAVNCGGEAHIDVFGIRYARDSNRVGTASDYGKQLMIARVPQQDQILYQTERYHSSTFGYDIPVADDGPYLLILKFSEVYFNAPNMKV